MENQNTLLKDRYSITRLLGKGGMGEVYLAEDKLLSRQVAVKKVVYADNEVLLQSAEKEAMVLARLQHQCLPKVLDYFNHDYAQYIVMEYIAGKDLGELLRMNQAPFSMEQVWGWLEPLLNTLEYLHSQPTPVVHRDIKPQNIKISNEGKLFLLDFGLVKDTPTRVKSDGFTPSVHGYSQSYAPLEQINGDPTSMQTDVYGLCATVYHLLTNVKPADALDRATKKIGGQTDPLRPAREVNPNIPLALSKILEAGLQLNSHERIKSVQALRQQLNPARNNHERIHIDIDSPDKDKGGTSIPSRLKTFFARAGWKRYALIAAAVAVLALSIWGIDRLVNSSEREARKLRDEAEKIERAEGLLSPGACAKYQEIAKKFSDSNAARDLVGKSNDCIIAPIRLEEANKIEKEKELNHTAAEAFKRVINSYPGSTFAKQAEAKVNEFERAKKATLQAWAKMKEAAYQSALDETVGLSPDLFKKLADSLLKSIKRYGEIDLEAVDARLVSHIQNSIAVFNRGRALYLEMEQDSSRIIAINEAELKKYGEQWRQYYENKTMAEINEMLRKYDERNQAFNKDLKGLETTASSISLNLKERFNSEEFYILIKKEG